MSKVPEIRSGYLTMNFSAEEVQKMISLHIDLQTKNLNRIAELERALQKATALAEVAGVSLEDKPETPFVPVVVDGGDPFSVTLPPGTYYISDLCYLFKDSTWDEVCNLIIDGDKCKDGHMMLPDGRTFVIMSTAHGDGTYEDNEGREYPVDAGNIAIMKVEYADKDVISDKLSQKFVWGNDFVVCADGMGTMHIGRFTIKTDYSDEEDQEEFEEEISWKWFGDHFR